MAFPPRAEQATTAGRGVDPRPRLQKTQKKVEAEGEKEQDMIDLDFPTYARANLCRLDAALARPRLPHRVCGMCGTDGNWAPRIVCRGCG